MAQMCDKGPYARHGFIVRFFYLIVALGWYGVTGFGIFRNKGVGVLCYHAVLQSQKDRFHCQMKTINTRKNLVVYVTFDDAFANLLDNALPILVQYQIPATIFAVAQNLGKAPQWNMPDGHPESEEKTMKAEELVLAAQNPLIKIGSHTLTHPDLAKIQPEKIRAELIESKQKLESLLDVCIEDIALPHGSYNETVLIIAQEAGYKNIYTLIPQKTDFGPQNPIIGRFSMSPNVWNIEFMMTCAGAYVWLYHWRRFIREIMFKGRTNGN